MTIAHDHNGAYVDLEHSLPTESFTEIMKILETPSMFVAAVNLMMS